jgi:hypothetical protein
MKKSTIHMTKNSYNLILYKNKKKISHIKTTMYEKLLISYFQYKNLCPQLNTIIEYHTVGI